MKNKTPTAIKITDESKGNMFIGCKVFGAVEIDKKAEDNKFIETDIITPPLEPKKSWYKKLFWQLFAVAGSLLVAYLAYKFGWR